MKKTICIDARMIRNSGIGVYIEKYSRFLLESDKWIVFMIGSKETLSVLFGQYSNYLLLEDYTPIYSIKEQLMLFNTVPECDIFWSPHYNIPLLPISAKKRVVTIPDIFHLVFNKDFSIEKRIYAKFVINRAVKMSNSITTISEFSKKEILKFTDVSPAKVTSVYLGIDLSYFNRNYSEKSCQNVILKYGLPQRFLLFVGNVKPHKNLARLMYAFQKIMLKDDTIDMLIVGKKEGFITGDDEIFSILKKNTELNSRVKFTGYVDSVDLPIIYNVASLFVFPSLYEGFGFPPLEAMACGCPVVASNAASIEEVCGDAAYYVDATDVESIAQGVLAVLNDETKAMELRNRGYQQVTLYNWSDSFRGFETVLNEL